MKQVFSAGLLILINSLSVIAQNGWRMEGFNPSRTNASFTSGPTSSPTFQVIASSVSGSLRRIGDDKSLVLADLANVSSYTNEGQLRWRTNVLAYLDGVIVDIALASSGIVYVSSTNRLIALDPQQGQPIWARPFAANSGNDSGPLVVGPDGTIYFHTGSKTIGSLERLTAINPDGARKWEYVGNTPLGSGRPVFSTDGSTVYLLQRQSTGGVSGKLVGLSAASGQVLFDTQCDVRGGIYAYSPSDIVYTGDVNTNLLQFPPDARTCSVSTSGLSVTDIVAVFDSLLVVQVLVPGIGTSYAAVDASGRRIWFPFDLLSSGFADRGGEGSGTFYAIAAQTNELIAIRAATGEELWRHQFSAPISGLGLAGDGNLYFVVGSDLIRTVNGPHAMTSSPKLGGPSGNGVPSTAPFIRLDAADNLTGDSNVASAATTQASGPVAAYSFNEGMGTSVTDLSGNGNVGTISGGTWTTAGKYSNALVFNGTNSRVTINDSASLHLTSGMTLEAWVYPTATLSGWRDIIYKQNDNYLLEASSTVGAGPTGAGTFGNGFKTVVAPSALSLNTWTHVAVTFDGANLTLWINGVNVATRVQTSPLTTSTLPLQIGGDTLYGQYFTGRIDEVRIYNRALTKNELEVDVNTPVGSVGDTTAPSAPANLRALLGGDPASIIARRSYNNNTSQTTHTTATFNSTGGDLIVVFGSSRENVATMTITDNKANTWISARGPTNHPSSNVDLRSQIWYAKAANVGTGHTVTINLSTAQALTISILVIKGSNTTAPIDVTSNITDDGGTAGTSITSASINTTQPGDLLIDFAKTPVAVTWTAGSGYTFESTASTNSLGAEDTIAGSSGSYTASWTMTPAANWQNVLTSVVSANASLSSNQIIMTWSSSSDNIGVTGYLIERCMGDGCSTFSPIGSTSGFSTTSYTDTGLSAATTYAYRIRATDAAGNLSAYSSTAFATTTGGADTIRPTAPANLSATAVSAAQIDLTWTASTDNVAVTGYPIERCQGPGCSNFARIATVTSTSYSDTGLSAGTSFSYRVRATDAAANLSDYSDVTSTTTDALPTAPSNLTATASGGTQINLTWNASSSTIGISNYIVERCQGSACSNFVQIATPTTTSYSDTGLTAATSYSYRVRAKDNHNNLSGYSNTATATTADTIAPSAPSNLTATAASNTQINLSWSASTDNVAVTGYPLERCQGADCSTFVQIASPTGTTFNDTGLTAGVSYSYRVRATDGAANLSGYSNVATAATPAGDTTPPTAPSNLTAFPGGSPASIITRQSYINGTPLTTHTTTAFDSTGGDLIVMFASSHDNVTFTPTDSKSNTWISAAGPTNHSTTNLRSQVWYAKAANVGTGHTVTMNLSTALPLVISILVIKGSNTTAPIDVISNITDDGGIPSTTITSAAIATTRPADLLIDFAKPNIGVTWTPGSGYTYESAASSNFLGTEDALAGSTGTYTASWSMDQAVNWQNVLISVVSANAAASSNQITLLWTASTDNIGVTGYSIERCSGAGCSTFAPVGSTGTTFYTDTALSPASMYLYRIRATDAAGNFSAYSNTASATTTAADSIAPTAPADLSATAVSTGQINLTWTASTDNVGVIGYPIERCQGPGCSNFAPIASATSTSYSDTGLSAGISYSYRVRATDAAANLSGYSNVATAATPVGDTIPPTAPSNLTAFPGGSPASIITRQSYINGTPLTTHTTTAFDSTGGDLIVMFASSHDNVTFTPTDSKSNTWISAAGPTNHSTINLRSQVWYAKAANVGTGHTVTMNLSTALPLVISILVIKDSNTTAPIDVISNITDDGGIPTTTITSAAITTTRPADLLIDFAKPNIGVTWTPGSGYTYESAASSNFLGTEDALAGSTGTYTASWSMDQAVNWQNVLISVVSANAAASSNQITLLWTASTDNIGVTGYSIERCSGAGCSTFAPVGSTGTTFYTDTALSPASTYLYRIRATDAAGNFSAYSNTASATTTAADSIPPTAPADLSATAVSTGQINLTWTASTDNVAVIGYPIERCQGPGCSNFAPIASATSTSYSDTELSAGISYSYRVRATDGAANLSGYSNVATAATPVGDTIPPTAPSNLTAFPGGSPASIITRQSYINGTPLTTHTTTAFDSTGGDLIVMFASSHDNVTFTPTDSKSNTWISAAGPTNHSTTNLRSQVWYAKAANVGTGHTVTMNLSTALPLVISILVIKDSNTTAPIDVISNITDDGGIPTTTITSAAITTTRPADLLIDFAKPNIGVTWTPGSGYTYESAASSNFLGTEDALAGSTGTYTASWSMDQAVNWQNVLISVVSANAAASSNQITLLWTASTDNIGVTGYSIERCSGAGCSTFAPVGSTGTTFYTDTALSPASTYLYRIRATDAAGNFSAYSNTASATTTAADSIAPTAPADLSATAVSTGQINLTWTASTDNVGVIGYPIERCQGPGCSNFAPIASATSTSYSDTGLSAGISYSYRVRATDGAANLSGYSNVATAATPAGDTIPPTAPSNLTAFPGGSPASIITRQSYINGTPLTTHTTTAFDSTGGDLIVMFASSHDNVTFTPTDSKSNTWISAAGPTNHSTTNLRSQVWYAKAANVGTGHTVTMNLSTALPLVISILVIKDSNTTAPIDVISNITDDGGIPTTTITSAAITTTRPADLLIDFAKPNIGVTWTPGSGYTYESAASSNFLGTEDALAGSTGTYTASWSMDQAVNWQNVLISVVSANAAASSNQITLLWTASTDNIGVTGYSIERCSGAGCSTFAPVGSTGTTFYTDTALSPASTYLYRIRATDAAGNFSAYSNTASATTTATAPDSIPPTTPANLSATAVSTGQINLTWTASTDNVAVTGYPIERCQGAGCSNFAPIATATSTSYSDTGLSTGISYSYQVRATDAAANLSDYSNVTSATTDALPTAPSNLTATASGGTQVNLSWNASTSTIGLSNYMVERCQGTACSNFVQIATPTTTSYSDTGLTAATSYSYRVRAKDNHNNLSGYSNTATATTADTIAPSAPSNLTATAPTATQINLTWTASTDNVAVTGYFIERCQGVGCSTFAQIATPSGTSYNNTGLAAATSYSYRVRATDAAGNLSGYSNVATATTQTAPPPVTGLIAAYGFNEGTGLSTADASPNGFTGTLANGPLWVTGKNGNALTFDGIDDRVSVSSSLDVSALPLTLEAWVRPTSFAQWRAIFSKRASYSAAGMRFDVALRTGNGRVYVTTFTSILTFTYSPPLNTWTHLAVVADSTGTKLYVNGELRQTLGVVTLGTGATAPVSIGRTGDDVDPFAGSIDDLRLYNRVLSQTEIQSDMNTPVTP